MGCPEKLRLFSAAPFVLSPALVEGSKHEQELMRHLLFLALKRVNVAEL
jgi:hypothetical protein